MRWLGRLSGRQSREHFSRYQRLNTDLQADMFTYSLNQIQTWDSPVALRRGFIRETWTKLKSRIGQNPAITLLVSHVIRSDIWYL